MKKRLTKSEMSIMNILWNEGKALTAMEIVEIAGKNKVWKTSSIHLLINKMLNKNVIEVAGFQKTTKNYARTFLPVEDREKFMVAQIMDGETVEEKKRIYKCLIEEEQDLNMIDYIQGLLEKQKKRVKQK